MIMNSKVFSSSDDITVKTYEEYNNFFFFSSRRRHTRCLSDWSSDVCSSDLQTPDPSTTWTLHSVQRPCPNRSRSLQRFHRACWERESYLWGRWLRIYRPSRRCRSQPP